MSELKKQIYYVRGMHCKSCEILLEKTAKELPEVKQANASTHLGHLEVVYEGVAPSAARFNNMLTPHGYHFSLTPFEVKDSWGKKISPFLIAAGIIVFFFIIYKSNWGASIAVDKTTPLPLFALFGLLAGFSTCAALVGGMVLSLSRQWSGGVRPHLLFNASRVASFTLLGALLGAVGSKIQFSPFFTAGLVFLVSFIMIWLGLQMLGWRFARKFHLALPKSWTGSIVKEKTFPSRYLPTALGALTVFLPCGFTLAAEGAALLSGAAW
ncbi:MAG TPA: sulfite exporter TauE/SafE family protein, partial [Patescibacteria group bacterium]|nr:sulfite exporter TauE/SafE family protein [Patescibacteria group bacterium]